jgi:hypothetical protein
MGQPAMPAWQRVMRKMALNLAIGFNNIFGSAGAAIYKPPEPTPQREGAPPPDDLARTFTAGTNKGDRLPPRERRGRD